MKKNKKIFIVTISVLLLIGFLTTSLTSYFVSRGSLRSKIDTIELPLTSDNIYSEIQRDLIRPIFISSLMSLNTFLRDWAVGGEKDLNQIKKYLKEIHIKFNTVTSFFVSDKTNKYYYYDGILKTISPGDKRDNWYYRVKNMAALYETNVDYDMANKDTITVFVNYKVFDYNKKYIGVTGVGLTVNKIKELIKKYQEKYNRNIYFADTSGNIILNSKINKKVNLSEMEGVSAFSNKILSSKSETFHFTRKSKRIHLNARFIPELKWYLLVEQKEEGSTSKIFNTLLLNLIFCLLITVIIIVLINATINAYKRKIIMLSAEDEQLKQINSVQATEISEINKALTVENKKLEEALAEVTQLSGFLPICASCKSIRDDKGYWNRIETYISSHSEAKFSHSICPKCEKALYPEDFDEQD